MAEQWPIRPIKLFVLSNAYDYAIAFFADSITITVLKKYFILVGPLHHTKKIIFTLISLALVTYHEVSYFVLYLAVPRHPSVYLVYLNTQRIPICELHIKRSSFSASI